MLFVYGALAWLAFMVTGILNGLFREAVLRPSLSERAAQTASTLVLCGVLLFEIAVFQDLAANGESAAALLGLGVMWMALTVLFEFGFGHYVAGESWRSLLENYNVAHGRIWPLVPLLMLVAPLVLGR
ncbi:MAG TPA: hypothetical protein VNN21_03445 [Dehalococcoidia bacterium]|nr:hypothetical protein [Dehalococcoidia bacterium]